jgi:hypothetical protein
MKLEDNEEEEIFPEGDRFERQMVFYWERKKGMMIAILIGAILFCMIALASIVYV